jgi:hypothetical protein
MVRSIEQIAAVAARKLANAKHINKQKGLTGYIDPETGVLNKNPRVNLPPNKIWVRVGAIDADDPGRMQIPVWNIFPRVTTRRANRWVWIDKDPAGEWEVVSAPNAEADEQEGGAASATYPSADPPPPELNLQTNKTRNLYELQPYSAGGLTLRVRPGWVGDKYWDDTTTLDLSADQTATSDKKALIVGYFDTSGAALTLKTVTGIDYPLTQTLDAVTRAEITSLLAALTVNHAPVFALLLSDSATSFSVSDVMHFEEIRQLSNNERVSSKGISPLTTKGDLYTYSTEDARLPVGANGQVLTANSAQATGLEWANPGALTGVISITRGNYAGLPASGSNTGDTYFVTDAPYTLVWDGSAWKARSSDYEVVVPTALASGATWVNQGTASVDTSTGAYYLVSSTTNSQINLQAWTAPATPYSKIFGLKPLPSPTSGSTVYVGWRQSSDGKLVGFGLQVGNGNVARLVVDKWSNATTFSAGYSVGAEEAGHLVAPILWLKIEDDGTNRKCYYGYDRSHFIEHHSVGRTDFLTGDEFFVGLRQQGGTQRSAVLVVSYE